MLAISLLWLFFGPFCRTVGNQFSEIRIIYKKKPFPLLHPIRRHFFNLQAIEWRSKFALEWE